MNRVINFLDTIASLLFVAAFICWSMNYIVSNWLFWIGCTLILPGVVKRHLFASFTKQCIGGAALIALFFMGLLFFNKPKINIKLPALPKVTIVRG